MKKLVMIILVLMLIPVIALGEIDLSTMSNDELADLKERIDAETEKRNSVILDVRSLSIEELKEIVYQSICELCSRKDFKDGASANTYGVNIPLKNWYGKGVILFFRDTKEQWFGVRISENDIERSFTTTAEDIAENLKK